MKNNMIFYVLLALIVVILITIFLAQARSPEIPSLNSSKNTEITVNDQTYNLEVVSDVASRNKGLMNRPHLPQNEGMLFVFETTSIYPFWMKNTLIPLDMIWLNKEKEVVHIKENAQPCESTIEAICKSIIPLKPALYVIELNAGEVAKLGLKTGNKIDFQL